MTVPAKQINTKFYEKVNRLLSSNAMKNVEFIQDLPAGMYSLPYKGDYDSLATTQALYR